MSNTHQQRNTPRGLATVAMLKTNFDAGKDHLSMFAPFVLDAVAQFPHEDMSVDQVQGQVIELHTLSLPRNTVAASLARLTRSGYVRREGGRYFRTEKAFDTPRLAETRAEIERDQLDLANS